MTVRLDRLSCVKSGETIDLPILLENESLGYTLGGYDFLIEYDSSITFIQVTEGDLLTECGWEYFTYSTPSTNTIRIVALAEINNGPIHPSCYADSSGTLALLRFQLGSTFTFTNEFVPVWWRWMDCGDNALASQDGSEMYVSDSVYFYNGISEYNITTESLFPTQNGLPDTCVIGDAPIPNRAIDFYSGGFHITTSGFQVDCPSNIIVPNDSGMCGAVVNFTIPINSSCSGMMTSSSPASGSFFPLGTTLVSTVAYDDLGHSDFCNFYITVEDNEAPQMICPTDTTLYTTPGEWWTQLFYEFSADDLCSDVTLSSSHPSGSYFSIGVTNIYCVATDMSGNADTTIFVVTVVDNEPPVLQCPDTIIQATDVGNCGASVEFSIDVTDNSNQFTLLTSVESGAFFDVGETTVWAIAEDPFGNIDSCSFVVVIEDNEPPQIECIADMTVPNAIDQCSAFVDYDLTVTDNCGNVELNYSISSSSYFPVGSTMVFVTATDESLNVDSCQFIVIVEDWQGPGIAVSGDFNLQADQNQCGAIVDYTTYISENCGGAVVTKSAESGSFFEIGSTLVTVSITDIAGYSATDSFTVIIEDNEPPLIENVSDFMVLSDSGYYGAFVSYDPQVSDNCQLETVTIDPPSGSYFDVGVHQISVSATDIYGNFDSTTFMVTVILKDFDNDLIADYEDNCRLIYNPLQEDSNNDSVGDACCCLGLRGNIDGSPENPPDNIGVDISDLVMLVTFIFDTGADLVLWCPDEGDFDASGGTDISDLVLMVSFIFESPNQAPSPCQ